MKPTKNIDKIAIYGSKSYAKLLSQIMTEDLGISPICHIDDFNIDRSASPPVLSYEEAFALHGQSIYVVLGIGYNDLQVRKELLDRLKRDKVKLLSLVHPSSYISKSSRIGEGAVILQNCTVSQNVIIGDGCVLWNGSNVSHDSKIEDNCFISPGVTICGFCEIGHSTFLGANSTVVDRSKIPKCSFIKAGTVFKGTN